MSNQNADFRFILEPYKGTKSRYTCPACKRPKKYSRYIDTHTKTHLPFEYGRCDREENCGYHLSPYKDGYLKKETGIYERPRVNNHFPKKEFKAKSITFIPQSVFSKQFKRI